MIVINFKIILKILTSLSCNSHSFLPLSFTLAANKSSKNVILGEIVVFDRSTILRI